MDDSRPKSRVLIVDDEADILDGLRDFLQAKLPVEVVTVPNGQAGLDELRRQPIDLILSDYKMPGMNGLEFLAEAQRVRPVAARIMMTAFADLDLALQALNEARILHFFTKPIEPDQLLEVVGAILRALEATRQRDAALSRSLDVMRRRRR